MMHIDRRERIYLAVTIGLLTDLCVDDCGEQLCLRHPGTFTL